MTINYLFISVSEHFLMKSESMSASSFDFPNFRFAFFFILHTFVERSAPALRFIKCHSRPCAFSVAQERQQQEEEQQRDGEAPSYRHLLPRRHLLSASERKVF